MPLPVIAGVMKVDLVWNNVNAPRPAINTMYFRDIPGGQTQANMATDINASFLHNQWLVQTNASSIVRLNVTPLDGATAGASFPSVGGATVTGGAAGEAILQGCCVVSLKSATRGPRGRNRIFLPWISESQQANGTLDAANLAAMATAWGTFQASMIAAGWQPVAVSALHSDAHNVINTVLRGALLTQRRRALR